MKAVKYKKRGENCHCVCGKNYMLGLFLIILGIIVFLYEVNFSLSLVLLVICAYVAYAYFCNGAR